MRVDCLEILKRRAIPASDSLKFNPCFAALNNPPRSVNQSLAWSLNQTRLVVRVPNVSNQDEHPRITTAGGYANQCVRASAIAPYAMVRAPGATGGGCAKARMRYLMLLQSDIQGGVTRVSFARSTMGHRRIVYAAQHINQATKTNCIRSNGGRDAATRVQLNAGGK